MATFIDGTIRTKCTICTAITNATPVRFEQVGDEVTGLWGSDFDFCRECGYAFCGEAETRIVIDSQEFEYPRR